MLVHTLSFLRLNSDVHTFLLSINRIAVHAIHFNLCENLTA